MLQGTLWKAHLQNLDVYTSAKGRYKKSHTPMMGAGTTHAVTRPKLMTTVLSRPPKRCRTAAEVSALLNSGGSCADTPTRSSVTVAVRTCASTDMSVLPCIRTVTSAPLSATRITGVGGRRCLREAPSSCACSVGSAMWKRSTCHCAAGGFRPPAAGVRGLSAVADSAPGAELQVDKLRSCWSRTTSSSRRYCVNVNCAYNGEITTCTEHRAHWQCETGVAQGGPEHDSAGLHTRLDTDVRPQTQPFGPGFCGAVARTQ